MNTVNTVKHNKGNAGAEMIDALRPTVPAKVALKTFTKEMLQVLVTVMCGQNNKRESPEPGAEVFILTCMLVLITNLDQKSDNIETDADVEYLLIL